MLKLEFFAGGLRNGSVMELEILDFKVVVVIVVSTIQELVVRSKTERHLTHP